MSEADQAAVRNALDRRGVGDQCPLCKQHTVDVTEAYGAVVFQDVPGPMRIGTAQTLPCALRRCRHCGFTMLHDVSKLGLA